MSLSLSRAKLWALALHLQFHFDIKVATFPIIIQSPEFLLIKMPYLLTKYLKVSKDILLTYVCSASCLLCQKSQCRKTTNLTNIRELGNLGSDTPENRSAASSVLVDIGFQNVQIEQVLV